MKYYFYNYKNPTEEGHQFVSVLPDTPAQFVIIQFLLEEIGSDRAHCECMRRFASFGTTHVIHCIITNCAGVSGNTLTNWCPFSRRVFKGIKVIFHCSWAVHIDAVSHDLTCHYWSFVVCENRSPQAGKRENWQFIDLSRLQFTSDESEFIPDYI
jgi:hypothetical protein